MATLSSSNFNGKPYTSGVIGGSNALTNAEAVRIPKSGRSPALSRLAVAVAKLPSAPRGTNSRDLFLP